MPAWRIQIQNWQPTSINKWLGKHWSVNSKSKKIDKEIIGAMCLSNRVPKATGKRTVGLTIYLGYRQRGCDPDNLWKGVLDALKHAGMLIDDSAKWCELMPIRFDRHPDRQKETIIELIEASYG